MGVSPEVLEVVRQWVTKAEHDLKNAEHTLTLKKDCPFDTVCFHAQQCAEKYLKALLSLHGVDFPKTHDLTELVALVPAPVRLKVSVKAFETLNPYAIETRYPNWGEELTRREAVRAVKLVKKVRDAVRAQMPKEVLKSKSRR
jgi:HEPN domain-containing protein